MLASKPTIKFGDELVPRRFWDKIVKQDDGCWIWVAGRFDTGYGAAWSASGKTVHAHRMMYEYLVGHIPSGMVLCHSCDVQACVNPEHLWIGTQAENIMDSISKGRHSSCANKGAVR